MEEFDSIKQEAKKVKEIVLQDSIVEGDLVGLDDSDLNEIKKQLVGSSANLETFPIIGMSEIGKTTLAKRLYYDKFIVNHVRAWARITQDYGKQGYDKPEILQGLLDYISDNDKKHCEESMNKKSSTSLQFYQKIKNHRYLIVMDDGWDIKVWDDVKSLFPDDKNKSRVVLTSRQEDVANCALYSFLHRMNFLKDDDGWNLFHQEVFGKDCCPHELEVIGRNIVKNSGGLPLAIVVIGGLLSKASKTKYYWANVAENLNSIASSDDQISHILSLSYNNLPHHLKECFLYMGIFPEDFHIRVPMLVKLWVAEEILQPAESTSFEDVAYECLSDLISRNLVLTNDCSCDGKLKVCKIHDLLRDLCVREAQRANFLHVTNDENCHDVLRAIDARRVSFHRHGEILYYHCTDPPNTQHSHLFVDGLFDLQELVNKRLLHVLHNGLKYAISLPNGVIQQVNLKYLSGRCDPRWPIGSIHKLRNLQSLILYDVSVQLPPNMENGAIKTC